jgi:O-antigen/teichoic acid export membrane protein
MQIPFKRKTDKQFGKENNSKFIRDMGWYLLGTLIPMGIGFVKTPIFTRYFSAEEYGYLGIVTITYTYISIFLYSWLSGCLWRYYNAYKNKNELNNLYSNLLFIYLLASFVLMAVTGIWFFMAANELVKQLVILSFFQYFFKELIGFYLIVLRLEGKAFRYNLIHSSRVFLSFVLLYVMTFIYHYRITSVIFSSMAVDMLYIIIIFFAGRARIRISFGEFSRTTMLLLFRFGSIGLVLNFFFLVISSSDRYIIALFSEISHVGIYNQVYNISQLSVAAFVTVFFNTINPRLNRELELNLESSGKLISGYLFVLLLFGLPVVTYLSLFSKQISVVLLGEEFREGFVIMPFIFISAFLYGIFMFVELKFKFQNKMRTLVTGVMIACGLNILMNFLLIPLYSYKAAAYSTLLAYVFLVVYFYSLDSMEFIKHRIYVKNIILALLVLLIQVASDFVLRNYVEINLWWTIAEALLFSLTYGIVFRRHIRELKIPV